MRAQPALDCRHDALLIPTYTPIRTDEENVSQPRVFFGGINVYLQQKFSLFRHTPWFLDRLLDFPRLLRWVARFAVKPTSSILQARRTVDRFGTETEISTKGRHDPCVGIRAVPIGEAMVACVVADHYLRQRGQVGAPPAWPLGAAGGIGSGR